jgi:hypothetical protein
MFVFSQELVRMHNPEERIERGASMIIERALVMLSLGCGAQVFQEDRVEIVADRIDGGSYDADMGIDAADSNGIKPARPQRLIEIGLEEGAEPALGQYDVLGQRREVMQYLFPGRSTYGVRFQFALEEEIFPQKTVIGKYYRNREASASFEEVAHGLYDLLFIPLRISGLLEAILKHIDDDHRGLH